MRKLFLLLSLISIIASCEIYKYENITILNPEAVNSWKSIYGAERIEFFEVTVYANRSNYSIAYMCSHNNTGVNADIVQSNDKYSVLRIPFSEFVSKCQINIFPWSDPFDMITGALFINNLTIKLETAIIPTWISPGITISSIIHSPQTTIPPNKLSLETYIVIFIVTGIIIAFVSMILICLVIMKKRVADY